MHPPAEGPAGRELGMTGFRLLRHGGFYHAVARYGEDLWVPFTCVGPPRHRAGAAAQDTASGGWTAIRTRRTGTCASATGCSTRTRTWRWSPRAWWWWPPTPGPGNWPGKPWAPTRPPSSAPPTASAARRWNCAPPGTWCRTRRATPPWAVPRVSAYGCGRTRTWRPSTAAPPTGCSWPSASSPPCGPPG